MGVCVCVYVFVELLYSTENFVDQCNSEHSFKIARTVDETSDTSVTHRKYHYDCQQTDK